jgi:DNA-binding NtrC family response regulator
MVESVARSSRPVLVSGPTGSGKELTVRAIHTLSGRPEGLLMDLNCGAFPKALIESLLFGHERGAFTGADRRHEGFFSTVGSGTLFLDEIGELPLELQATLLRVLETGTFRPIGSTLTHNFVGRIVAATHVDLADRVSSGRFRADLYYRLNVLEIRIPALEERRVDIPVLALHLASELTSPLEFTEDALNILERASWPGNVRQLRNVIDRIAVFSPKGPVTAAVLSGHLGGEQQHCRNRLVSDLVNEVLQANVPDKLLFVESALIDEALRITDGNKSAAARLLGVHRKIVERRLERRKLGEAKTIESVERRVRSGHGS